MLESIPIPWLARTTYLFAKNIYRRIWPRKPVEAIAVLRSHHEIGNDVMLVNTSNDPIHIHSIDVVDAAKEGDETNKCACVFNLEDQLIDVRLEPKESHTFNFSEGDYFPMNPKNGKYFIRVWLNGQKKPLWLSL
jgi:hypothetical protein